MTKEYDTVDVTNQSAERAAMPTAVLSRHSLKTRLSIATLLIFLASFWSLSIYAFGILRDDTERLLGAQQLSTATYVASEVDGKPEDRLNGLELNARAISAATLANPAAMRDFLAQRHFLLSLFNAGDGTVVAEAPPRLDDRSPLTGAVTEALRTGKPVIGQPGQSAASARREFTMAAPILDGAGGVIGALAGTVDLDQPNFLDQITAGRYGDTGGYVVLVPKQRLIVTATDKSRILEKLPTPGVNPTLDRFLDGYEGSAVYTTPRGVDVLGSAKRIGSTNWLLGVTIPTAEAFAPIREMRQRMLLATLVLTLLAGALTWLLLGHELSPLVDTTRTLDKLAASDVCPLHLPVRRQDEIGKLIGGFNRLLDMLDNRDRALGASESSLKEVQSIAGIGSYVIDIAAGRWQSSAAFDELFGIDAAHDRSLAGWAAMVHDDDRSMVLDHFRDEVLGRSSAFDKTYRIVRQNDGVVRWAHGLGRLEFDAQRRPARMFGTLQDITERKLAEDAMRDSHEVLNSILSTTRDGFWRIDTDGYLLAVNAAYCHQSGYSREELEGAHVAMLDVLEDDIEIAAHIDRIIASGHDQFESRHRRKNGSLWDVEVSITYRSGNAGELHVFLRDISERKQA